jgi:hypothetical protein
VISEVCELLDGRVGGEAEAATEEDRRRTSVGPSGEGFALGWDRGASLRRGEANSGVDWTEEGRVGVFHSGQETAAAMACGGASGARAGARLGSRRSRADARRGEAAWSAKNCSGAVEDGQRGSPRGLK